MGGAPPVDWNAAVEWVAESEVLGCSVIQYIVLPQAAGDVLVDLTAIEPLAG